MVEVTSVGYLVEIESTFSSTGRRKIFCQQCLVAIKKGETLLLEHKQDDDCFMEAGMEIDEAPLLLLR